MKDELRPAVEALEAELRDLERRVSETKNMINRLYQMSGGSPVYADVTMPAHRSAGPLRADQFYGKVLTTAAREYLEMRKVSNRGPASPREIYEALVEGGYKFDTKNDENAVIGLRQTLRKNSAVFHRIPNGQYGLLIWYPKARTAKSDDNGESGTADSRGGVKRVKRPAKTKRTVKRKKPMKRRNDTGQASKKPEDDAQQEQDGSSIADRVLAVMNDGAVWTIDLLKKEIPDASGRVMQGALLSLLHRQLVTRIEKGKWRVRKANSEGSDELPEPAKVIPMKAASA